MPWHGDYQGKGAVPKFFEAIAHTVDVKAFEPGEFVAQGDTVVSTVHFGCRVRATGRDASTRWVFLWKFRDGRVESYEQFHDPALAAAFP